MAASLPQIDTSALEARHTPVLSGMQQRAAAIAKRPLTLTTATMAQELDSEAKAWIDMFAAETTPIKKALFDAHRMFTTFCGKLTGPAESTRQVCRRIMGDFAMAERRKAEEAQREQERLAREAAEAQRKAEADALMAQAAAENNPALVEEAIAVEQAPIVPIIVPVAEATKVEGTSTRFELFGTVEDRRALLSFLLAGERDDLITEILGDGGDWKVNPALRRGLSLPGVRVDQRPVVSNRRRA